MFVIFKTVELALIITDTNSLNTRFTSTIHRFMAVLSAHTKFHVFFIDRRYY